VTCSGAIDIPIAPLSVLGLGINRERIMSVATTMRTLANDIAAVAEFLTDASTDALNAALSARGISADRIIAVLPLPGQTLVNPTKPQFRVLYRTA
jgi:hypothetical protein